MTLLAAIAFGPVLAMYGAVAIFVGSATIDVVLEGISVEKAVFIISDEHDAMSRPRRSNVIVMQSRPMFADVTIGERPSGPRRQ